MIERTDELVSTPARELAVTCIERAIEAANPTRLIERHLTIEANELDVNGRVIDLDAFERILVVGGGKAAAAQAHALYDVIGDRIDGGVVVTPAPPDMAGPIRILPGDHPIPSEDGVASTAELMAILEGADEQTLVIAVLSGGGSALLPAPAGVIDLEALQAVTNTLLESGATIEEINAVRKHISKLKGGGLARLSAPATVITLVTSDVIGDQLPVIASGPFVPDPTTYRNALSVISRYDLSVPSRVRTHLENGAAGELPETPKPGDPTFDRIDHVLLAGSRTGIQAAFDHVSSTKWTPLWLSSSVRGEAREAAKTHVAIAEESLATGRPVDPPAVLLSAGETTVTVRGDGVGGPNLEFALSAAIELAEHVTVGAVDTDGIDGASPAAGAIVDGGTVNQSGPARAALAANDAYPYLADRGDTVETGPTETNINDFRVVVIASEHR